MLFWRFETIPFTRSGRSLAVDYFLGINTSLFGKFNISTEIPYMNWPWNAGDSFWPQAINKCPCLATLQSFSGANNTRVGIIPSSTVSQRLYERSEAWEKVATYRASTCRRPCDSCRASLCQCLEVDGRPNTFIQLCICARVCFDKKPALVPNAINACSDLYIARCALSDIMHILTNLRICRMVMIGAPSLALEHYRAMGIKNVQNDTLSHFVLSRASTFSLAATGDITYSSECIESSQIYNSNSQEVNMGRLQ